MIKISERLHELDELKRDIYDKVEDLSQNADDESLEAMRKIKEHLENKYSGMSTDESIEHLNRVNKGLSFYQRFMQSFESDLDIDPGRLMGLTDGIFGMVMTLLIFGIGLPELQITNYSDFLAFFSSLANTIGVTIISFILLSCFWIYHHEFIKINNLNMPYLWMNVLFLICISFIPFSTSIIGNYSHFFLSEMIFGINILLTVVSFLFMFRYAYNKEFLQNKPSQSEKKYIYTTFLIIMALTVIVSILDFNVSKNFIYLFLLVPVISTVRDIMFRMNHRNL